MSYIVPCGCTACGDKLVRRNMRDVHHRNERRMAAQTVEVAATAVEQAVEQAENSEPLRMFLQDAQAFTQSPPLDMEFHPAVSLSADVTHQAQNSSYLQLSEQFESLSPAHKLQASGVWTEVKAVTAFAPRQQRALVHGTYMFMPYPNY